MAQKTYLVNKKVLAMCKEKGHCVCDKSKTCPCDDWLNDDKCVCRAYVLAK